MDLRPRYRLILILVIFNHTRAQFYTLGLCNVFCGFWLTHSLDMERAHSNNNASFMMMDVLHNCCWILWAYLYLLSRTCLLDPVFRANSLM